MISALVVSHNAERYLARCLASLRAVAESGIELEIIVVDNASTDGSVDLIHRDFPDVFIEPLAVNVGFGAANNHAARLARGNRLLLLNSDAWLAPEAMLILDRALDSDAKLGLVAPQLRYPDGSLQTTWAPTCGVVGEALQRIRNRLEGWSVNHRQLPPVLRLLTGPGWYSAACLMVRRSAYDEVGGFDESYFLYFEDVDLCCRLLQAGWQLRADERAAAYHVGGASRDPERHEVLYRTSQLAFYEAYRPAWEVKLLRRRLHKKLARTPPGETHEALAAILAGPPQTPVRP